MNSKPSLILAIDQGTTGTKVLIVNHQLEVVAEHSTPFEQHFPQPGWVEHDLDQVWDSVLSGIRGVEVQIKNRGLSFSDVSAIGITNQRETVCFWDRTSTAPLMRALVWQDRRTAARCEELKASGLEPQIQKQTGLLLDPYFSATKIEWAIKNNPVISDALRQAKLAVGTIDSFILAKLTSGVSHATEPSNASRTLLMNLSTGQWNDEYLKLFGITRGAMPKIQPSFSHFGVTRGVAGLPDGIPITGMIGDQQSALLGQACLDEGQAKCTFGTGAFLLMNTGSKPRISTHRLLTTVAWTDSQGHTTYALEGSAFMAGATIQWLRDGVQFVRSAQEIEALAASVASSDGVMFVPAFTGMGAPHWDPEARALICGISRGTTRGHIARAALEGIAFQNVEILQAMEKDLGTELVALNVDGGASKNDLLMQIQSDLLGRNLFRPQMTETTSLGAVFAAGLGAGIWTDLHAIKKVWKLDREFSPLLGLEERSRKMAAWKRAINRAKSR